MTKGCTHRHRGAGQTLLAELCILLGRGLLNLGAWLGGYRSPRLYLEAHFGEGAEREVGRDATRH